GEGKAQYRLPRGRSRHCRSSGARARSGLQGVHYSPWPRPGCDHVPAGGRPLQFVQARIDEPDLLAVRRRIAEEMTLGFDGVTTGASNDIMRATQLARNMVTKWGLSEKLGP